MGQVSTPLKCNKNNPCCPKLIQTCQLYTLIPVPMINQKDLSPNCGFQPCPNWMFFFRINPISSYLSKVPFRFLVSTLDQCKSLCDAMALKLFTFSRSFYSDLHCFPGSGATQAGATLNSFLGEAVWYVVSNS